MQINKNDFIGHLKTSIYEVCFVTVCLPRGVSMQLRQVNGCQLNEMLRNDQRFGRPECFSFENNRWIHVFPRADKRYRLKVLGTQFIEQ